MLGPLLVLALAVATAPHPTLAAPADSATVAVSDTTPGRAPRGPYVMPPLGKGILDHLHNKLVHFPIVLGLAGLVLLVLAGRRPELLPVAHATIWLAAASAVAAYFSGRFLEEAFKGRPKEWLMQVHLRASTAVTLASGVWAVFVGLQPRRRGIALVLGVVVVVFIASAAYLGGLVAHGR